MDVITEVNTAVYLRNRCPSKANGNETPLEIWSGKKPDVRRFRTFGSHVTALKRPGLTKWEARGEDFVFVGYSIGSKGYRLWRKGTIQVINSYDVRFIKDPRFVTQAPQENVELLLKSLIMKDKDTREDSSLDDVLKIKNKNSNEDINSQTLDEEEETEINDDAETELNQEIEQFPSTNPRRGPGRQNHTNGSERETEKGILDGKHCDDRN